MANHVVRPLRVSEVAAKLGLPYHRALRLLRGLNVQFQGAVLINRSRGSQANRWVVPSEVVKYLRTGGRLKPPSDAVRLSVTCEADGAWIVEVPEFGVSAVGTTEDEACQRAKAAVLRCLSERMAAGEVDVDQITFRATA